MYCACVNVTSHVGKHESPYIGKYQGNTKAKMADNVFERYYANLFHTGDTKEANNSIDNIMCQDILINVIFGCES